MAKYERLAEEFCTCKTADDGTPIWSPRCPSHHVKDSGFSAKRLELFLAGKTLLGLARNLSESPHFPDNPYNMTFQDLISFINAELSAMNERGEP